MYTFSFSYSSCFYIRVTLMSTNLLIDNIKNKPDFLSLSEIFSTRHFASDNSHLKRLAGINSYIIKKLFCMYLILI